MFVRGRVGPTRCAAARSALLLGGAIGNLVDRVASGEVVDFIEVGIPQWHWPIFNVADSAITIGILLLLVGWSRRARARGPRVPDEPPGPAGS